MAVPEGYKLFCIDLQKKVFFWLDVNNNFSTSIEGSYLDRWDTYEWSSISSAFQDSIAYPALGLSDEKGCYHTNNGINLVLSEMSRYGSSVDANYIYDLDKNFNRLDDLQQAVSSEFMSSSSNIIMGRISSNQCGNPISTNFHYTPPDYTVHFKIGSQLDYDSLQTKDSNTLYFISEGKIYKGSDLMGTKNSALTASNTTNVNTTIDGNEISMNLTSGFLDSVNNAGSQWGEIPVCAIPSGIDENTYYYIYYDNDIDPPIFESHNNNAYFNFNDNYYLLTSEEWSYANKRFRPYILGSNIQNIVHTQYNGNNIIQLKGPIDPTPV